MKKETSDIICIITDRIDEDIKELNKKLERFIERADTKFDLAGEMFNKLQKQIKELEQKAKYDYKKLEGNIGAVTTAHNMGVELAKEDSAYNHNKIAQLDNKIDEKVDDNARLLQDATRKIFVNIDTINDSVDSNKNDINKIYGLLKSGNISFKEDYDILESKYHQLRSELDCVYKVLEMDALDIQDLYEQLENHPKKGTNNAK
mgnify:CR=1 FL=1